MPGILDLFRGKTTTPAEPPVTTGELEPVTGSEVEPVTPKNENIIDFQTTLYDKWLADWLKCGNLPTHSYDYGKGGHFVEIYHPERASFPTSEMYGANSRQFVLSKDYDIKEHARRRKRVYRFYWSDAEEHAIARIIAARILHRAQTEREETHHDHHVLGVRRPPRGIHPRL